MSYISWNFADAERQAGTREIHTALDYQVQHDNGRAPDAPELRGQQGHTAFYRLPLP